VLVFEEHDLAVKEDPIWVTRWVEFRYTKWEQANIMLWVTSVLETFVTVFKATNLDGQTRRCKTVTYFSVRFSAKLPFQFGVPTRRWMLGVRRKLLTILDMVGEPIRFCDPFRHVVRFTVFEIERRLRTSWLPTEHEDLE